MKITKTDISYLVQNIFVWLFINFSFNLLGLWISKLLDKAGFNYLQSITNEFVKPLLIQSAVFIIIFILAYVFLKNRKITLYIFTLFQVLAFHIIFVINLSTNHMIHFETTLDDWGLEYLSNMGQYFVDILYIYLPLEGIFKNGLFIPRNTGVFYLEWIFLVLVYFGAITWLSSQAVGFFFTSKKIALNTEKAATTTENLIDTAVEMAQVESNDTDENSDNTNLSDKNVSAETRDIES